MANYIAQWRTNAFRVKDAAAFKQDMTELPVEVVTQDDGRFVLLRSLDDDCGSLPTEIWNEETGDSEELDLPGLVATHLKPGEVAIFMEVGYEKLRYLVGYAYAINSEGQTQQVDLTDIYTKAQVLVPGKKVARAEY